MPKNRGPGNPHWRKGGPSPNPSGGPKVDVAALQARIDALEAAAALTKDGYTNQVTGLGMTGWDKRQATSFTPTEVGVDEAIDLWRGNDLAARIVETIPSEMLRQGFEVCVQDAAPEDGEDNYELPEVTAEDRAIADWYRARRDQEYSETGKDLAERVMHRLEELGAEEHLWNALCYQRALGGGAVLLGVNDLAADLRAPLDLTKTGLRVEWLQSLELGEFQPFEWYTNPRHPKYGQPAIYLITPTLQGTSYVAPGTEPEPTAPTAYVHESRMLVFRGTNVSRRRRSANGYGMGDSIFVRVGEVLRDFGVSWASAGAIVSEFAGAVYSVEDLTKILAADNGQLFAKRMQLMNLMKSTFRAMVIDKKDTYTKEQTPITGLPDLLMQFMYRLAAAADMPITLLFGMSPGGMNATGDSDIRLFYDRVKSRQKRALLQPLRTLVGLLFREAGSEPETWSIEFNPLWQPTAKEDAEARKIQMEIDVGYIDRQVYSPEECAHARFGGDGYSFATPIDFEARAMLEKPIAAPVKRAGEDPEAKPEPPPLPPGAPFGGPKPFSGSRNEPAPPEDDAT